MVIFVTPAIAVIIEDLQGFHPFAKSEIEPAEEAAETAT
jgi:hypothetical protein